MSNATRGTIAIKYRCRACGSPLQMHSWGSDLSTRRGVFEPRLRWAPRRFGRQTEQTQASGRRWLSFSPTPYRNRQRAVTPTIQTTKIPATHVDIRSATDSAHLVIGALRGRVCGRKVRSLEPPVFHWSLGDCVGIDPLQTGNETHPNRHNSAVESYRAHGSTKGTSRSRARVREGDQALEEIFRFEYHPVEDAPRRFRVVMVPGSSDIRCLSERYRVAGGACSTHNRSSTSSSATARQKRNWGDPWRRPPPPVTGDRDGHRVRRRTDSHSLELIATRPSPGPVRAISALTPHVFCTCRVTDEYGLRTRRRIGSVRPLQ